MLVVKIMHQIPWKKMCLTFFVEGSTYLGGQTDKDVIYRHHMHAGLWTDR
jgi:hypothetical protein